MSHHFNCYSVYRPPAGKAVVVTSVTYQATPDASNVSYGFLTVDACNGTYYDTYASSLDTESQAHTFPAGLPMPNVDIESYNGYIEAFITGYLIPASQLPASPPAAKLPARLTLPTH